jgi:hypothetical protein
MEKNKQKEAALYNMIQWLADPHELGKEPNRIEIANEFDYNNMHYYIFKFKKTHFSKNWLLGICGGFESDSLEPCGHTFSNMENYDENNCKEKAIEIINFIMDYWKNKAIELEKI